MARWDKILSLPVQNPPTLEFSSADLVWSTVEGWHENIDRVALIPYARVDDFVRGESNNKECPTRFHVEARRKRTLKTSCKPKVDGILEYILYWCSFGPDDHRKGGIVRPSRTTYVPKNKPAGRPNTKRGCTCHFIVKRLSAEPSVALVIYNEDKHVDKKGLPCHGPQDKKAVGTRAMYAPYISDELLLRVLSLLHVGVSVETIMQRHNESVEKQGGPCNRDDLLTHRFVRRQERSIRRSTYELDEDDAVSISMWVKSQQNSVFFYEDFSDSDPFVLGIQSEWQLQQMIRFGNCRLLASNSKFGSNKLKYPIHSLVVFNSDNKAIPVAWIITSGFGTIDTHRWMRALYNRVCAKDPTWKLAGFVVDDPLADTLAIREVFQCSVLICFWKVRHAWHKNLIKRCSEIETRAAIAKSLGLAVKKISKEHNSATEFDDLMENFVDAVDFMDYFKAVWYPRLGMWVHALGTFPLASQETCAAMEFYHNQMKVRLFNEKDSSVYQHTDWFVNKLTTKVHSYFWLDEYSGKEDFARYWKEEWMSGPTAWRKSLMIPDDHVVMECELAKVFDLENQDTTYLIRNPGSEYAICDCSWAKVGNLCEHILKLIRFCRCKGSVTSSVSMLHYSRALINMLKCPPFDSLARDHAAALAVWVQMQLNVQIGSESQENAIEQQMDRPDRDQHSEEHCPSNTISSQNENRPAKKHKLNDCEAGDLGDNPLHLMTTESIYNNESRSEMEVDSSSISTSPTQLFSANENAISLLSPNDEDLNDAILPSAEVEFKNLNGLRNVENNHTGRMIMDIETQSICNVLSTDCSLDREDILSSCISESDAMEKSSPIVAKQLNLIVGEVSDGIDENGDEDSIIIEEFIANELESPDKNADSQIDV